MKKHLFLIIFFYLRNIEIRQRGQVSQTYHCIYFTGNVKIQIMRLNFSFNLTKINC